MLVMQLRTTQTTIIIWRTVPISLAVFVIIDQSPVEANNLVEIKVILHINDMISFFYPGCTSICCLYFMYFLLLLATVVSLVGHCRKCFVDHRWLVPWTLCSHSWPGFHPPSEWIWTTLNNRVRDSEFSWVKKYSRCWSPPPCVKSWAVLGH